jgi:hypothetical protein
MEPAVTRWDNIEILQIVDRYQEALGGGPVTMRSACDLIEEIAGHRIAEAVAYRADRGRRQVQAGHVEQGPGRARPIQVPVPSMPTGAAPKLGGYCSYTGDVGAGGVRLACGNDHRSHRVREGLATPGADEAWWTGSGSPDKGMLTVGR